MMEFELIPRALRVYHQWICWQAKTRDGTQTKVPVDPHTDSYASVSDPSTWTDFETAQTALLESSANGLGFVFTDHDPFVGVDLDNCRDPETGRPDAWAKAIIKTLDSYTEISPSETGYHIIVHGTLPTGGNRSGDIELYEEDRFFTVTGNHVTGQPQEIMARTKELESVHAEHIATPRTLEDNITETGSKSLPDEELLSRARNAKNGEKFSRLWNGDTTGYDSHSEADMALCFILAFWTGRNNTQMDRLFRKSGLYREKWDEPHYSDGRTYGEQTITEAVYLTDASYQDQDRTDSRNQDAPNPTDSQPTEDEPTPNPPTQTHNDPEAIQDLQESITTLSEELASLQTATEFLHTQLTDTRTRTDTLAERLTRLETTHPDKPPSLLERLFD